MNILIFIIGLALMILMLKYRWQIRGFTGDIDWAEQHLGGGGTTTLISLLAILLFIVCLMWSMGTIQDVLESTFGRFF